MGGGSTLTLYGKEGVKEGRVLELLMQMLWQREWDEDLKNK